MTAAATWAKLVGVTVLLIALYSLDFAGLTLSSSITKKPIEVVVIAFFDTIVLGYFVIVSRWRGWLEWGAVFSVFYGVNYVLTTLESVYVPSVLPSSAVFSVLVNGAMVSGIFAAALVLVLGEKGVQTQAASKRLAMPAREWVWKTIGVGILYLVLFLLFGLALYGPLARLLDPVAFAEEQSAVSASAAALIFPTELVRGMIWVLLGAPAILALPFGWKKTGVVMGLIFAVPDSGMVLFSTTIASGLIPAHFAEVLAENLVFGVVMARVLHLRERLPST